MSENLGSLAPSPEVERGAPPAEPSGAEPPAAPPVGEAPRARLQGRWSRRGARAWMVVLPVDVVTIMLPTLWMPGYVRPLLLTAVLTVLSFSAGGRYRAKLHLSLLDELPAIVARLMIVIALVATIRAVWLVVIEPGAVTAGDDSGEVVLFLSLPVIAGVLLGRLVTTSFILWARRHLLIAHPTILVGGGVSAAELATLLKRHRRYGLDVIGFVDDGTRCEASFVVPHLGPVTGLDDAVAARGAEVLLIAGGNRSDLELLHVLRQPACARCDLLAVPRLYSLHTQTGMADHIGSIPILRIRTPSFNGVARVLKHVTDVVLAALALLVLSPVLAACALAVRIEGGPGVIFRQQRVGRDGLLFDCLKFRSMAPRSTDESATQWSIAEDLRIGPVGRFLRRTSLDELPQLWNVVRGDMALVGPRPERPHFVEQFSGRYVDYATRHRVPVGLTGLAQVSGLRGDTPISDRARFDNYYIENWSLWLDVKVLLRTIREVLFARGR